LELASKAKPFFTHTAVASLPNHQMIEDIDVEQLAGRDDLVRDEHVLNTYMENHLTV